MEFWDFGVEVDIEPPDPADIVAPGSSDDLPSVRRTMAAQPSPVRTTSCCRLQQAMGLGDVDDVRRLEP